LSAKYIEAKLPPETEEMTSTSSRSDRPPPIGVRSSSRRTPYASAAARVPPPEKVRMMNVSSSFCDGK
jgi:hypothetical protein